MGCGATTKARMSRSSIVPSREHPIAYDPCGRFDGDVRRIDDRQRWIESYRPLISKPIRESEMFGDLCFVPSAPGWPAAQSIDKRRRLAEERQPMHLAE